MGIGSITSTDSRAGMQTAMANPTDSKAKNIKNEITDVQQQMQVLSSKEELSSNEKMIERKKLQKELSGLNTELRQHQEEYRKSQKQETTMAKLQESYEPSEESKAEGNIQAIKGKTEKTESSIQEEKASPGAADKANKKNPPTAGLKASPQGNVITQGSDGIVILKDETNPDGKSSAAAVNKQAEDDREESKREELSEKKRNNINTDMDTGMSAKETQSMISADISSQQAERQGTVITRIRNGIAILKNEISQDESNGIDTGKKREELEEMQRKEQRAMTMQFSILGKATNTADSAGKALVPGTQDSTQAAQADTKGNAVAAAFNPPTEESLAFLQNFHVALGN